ncbi:putative ADA regulatory protein [Cellvibrio japonicus Ueda107]|uniref:methylated-DNA--[protein]-cysteine S-methyltransferase n=1 Tax=Cellvibrio japonicus (strain Ueda107) TaxID=498211 RepID=B3PER0_CELJU|nr:putative ADA regulatory protein [Cellvibrio japonicus Ueda107]QEI12164.1 methylated-DNA--[protein]-cysteine S-methyltransferase [Cellvibrio japonicus]QEI15738.1 methylated-DNA--[protein]-cysteine S-methyltransferase [Cellvibrio japonicus]QEI19316.1 methylated-DNA--[protein]-cysteine S-methyltransferase [Cellvibrio japonicus]
MTPQPTDSPDPRWHLLNDASAEGQFFYAVITTGIYCRPGCPSRRPNPDNVRFFPSPDAAQAAGFRPCKRCHPQRDTPDSLIQERITALCRFIENADGEPSLQEMANYAGLSRYHLHRLFRQVTGLTPKAYAKASQQGANQHHNPYRGKLPMNIEFALDHSSLGLVLVARTEKGVCAILLGDQEDTLVEDVQRRFPHASLHASRQLAKELAAIIAYIEQPSRTLDLPLDIRGTLFQQKVWQALREIPAGETRSYKAIAGHLGSPDAVRAVAGACAANPLGLAIPCHRVVRSDGGLSGYRWGVERKRELLKREAKAAGKNP